VRHGGSIFQSINEPTNTFKKSKPYSDITKLPELGLAKKDFVADFKRYYSHRLGCEHNCRSPHYAYEALSLAISSHKYL
jgi:starch phosphorylase